MPKIKLLKEKIEKVKVKQYFVKCKKCGDEIFANIHKKMIDCKCKAIAVDGCEYYVRTIGNKEDCEIIEK